jgi:hypothetical protein
VLGPLILLPPNAGAFGEIVVKHELAHFIASGSLKDAPEWLHEGLAQVMQTAKYDSQTGKILFGQFSPELVFEASFKVPADKFMWPWPQNLTVLQKARYYGRSWLLVHYLIDDELQQFLNFLVRVRNGEKWKSAWDQEILVRLSEIDETLDRYHERAKYGLWTVDAYLPDMSPLHASTVPPAEALALRAVLQACATNPARTEAQNLQAAAADLQAASAIDPTSARMSAISAALEKAAHEQKPK